MKKICLNRPHPARDGLKRISPPSPLASGGAWTVLLWVLTLFSGLAGSSPLMADNLKPDKSEWNLLTQLISQRINWNNDRLRKEVLRQEALILKSDTTPVSIVLRRTEALLKHLQGMGVPLEKEQIRLGELKQLKAADPFDHFTQVTALRRAIAFQNLRYYGIYSNKARGLRKQATASPQLIPQTSSFKLSTPPATSAAGVSASSPFGAATP